MQATVLSIGKSVLNGALSYGKSVVAGEVALQLGLQGDHAFITDELEMMQAFLEGDVAYDVEDSLQVG